MGSHERQTRATSICILFVFLLIFEYIRTVRDSNHLLNRFLHFARVLNLRGIPEGTFPFKRKGDAVGVRFFLCFTHKISQKSM